jgi:hypothetical protein
MIIGAYAPINICMQDDKDFLDDIERFERKTFKEVTVWDWLGRILPMSVLAIIIVFHFFKWNTALELVLEVATVIFFIMCFIWWYWALYKIAVSIKYMRASHRKFIGLYKEINTVKKIVKDNSE